MCTNAQKYPDKKSNMKTQRKTIFNVDVDVLFVDVQSVLLVGDIIKN